MLPKIVAQETEQKTYILLLGTNYCTNHQVVTFTLCQWQLASELWTWATAHHICRLYTVNRMIHHQGVVYRIVFGSTNQRHVLIKVLCSCQGSVYTYMYNYHQWQCLQKSNFFTSPYDMSFCSLESARVDGQNTPCLVVTTK